MLRQPFLLFGRAVHALDREAGIPRQHDLLDQFRLLVLDAARPGQSAEGFTELRDVVRVGLRPLVLWLLAVRAGLFRIQLIAEQVVP